MNIASRTARASGILLVVGGLVLWEASGRLGLVVYDTLPLPSQVAARAPAVVADPVFLGDVVHTVLCVLIGWGASSVAGLAAGIALALAPRARAWSGMTIEVLRPLPVVALVPVLVLLLGATSVSEVTLVFIASLWPTLTTVSSTARRIPQRRREAARQFGTGPVRTVWCVVLPSLASTVVATFRLSISLAVVVAIVIEMVAVPVGLGYRIISLQQALRPEDMLVYVVAVTVIGVGVNLAVDLVGRRLVPGYRPGGGS